MCNQRLVFKLSLTMGFSFVAVGNIVNFSEMLENVRAFGIDYTTYNLVNGQIMFPYFIVTSVNLRSTSVDIEVMQLGLLYNAVPASDYIEGYV